MKFTALFIHKAFFRYILPFKEKRRVGELTTTLKIEKKKEQRE
jgi:hypothetical protein